MEFKDLYFGVILEKDAEEYRFISHCFCKDNIDPEITLINKDGEQIEIVFSKLQQEWKVKII